MAGGQTAAGCLGKAKLTRIGIAPKRIRIEATERGFMNADAGRGTIQAFPDAGHPAYFDDFGTGYSSLSQPFINDFKIPNDSLVNRDIRIYT